MKSYWKWLLVGPVMVAVGSFVLNWWASQPNGSLGFPITMIVFLFGDILASFGVTLWVFIWVDKLNLISIVKGWLDKDGWK